MRLGFLTFLIATGFFMSGCECREYDDSIFVDSIEAQYYKPSRYVCERYGGEYDYGSNSECRANLIEARHICQLPNNNDWYGIIRHCQDYSYDSDTYYSYLSCINDNGYLYSSSYWSSTPYRDSYYEDELGYSASLYDEDTISMDTSVMNNVRCVAGGLQ